MRFGIKTLVSTALLTLLPYLVAYFVYPYIRLGGIGLFFAFFISFLPGSAMMGFAFDNYNAKQSTSQKWGIVIMILVGTALYLYMLYKFGFKI